ncbi:MAG: hypothetical protein WCS42_26565 [Verrucomicrobiota bacterium]
MDALSTTYKSQPSGLVKKSESDLAVVILPVCLCGLVVNLWFSGSTTDTRFGLAQPGYFDASAGSYLTRNSHVEWDAL